MDITSVLLIASIALASAAFILRPFLFGRMDMKEMNKSVENPNREHLRSSLLAEKERILSAIQELDFDQALQKIPEDQYPVQRAEMMEKAAGILKQLDDLEVNQNSSGSSVAPGQKYTTGDYDEVEALIAKHRIEGKRKINEFCPHCGKPITDKDKYCPKCGKPILNTRTQ